MNVIYSAELPGESSGPEAQGSAAHLCVCVCVCVCVRACGCVCVVVCVVAGCFVAVTIDDHRDDHSPCAVDLPGVPCCDGSFAATSNQLQRFTTGSRHPHHTEHRQNESFVQDLR